MDQLHLKCKIEKLKWEKKYKAKKLKYFLKISVFFFFPLFETLKKKSLIQGLKLNFNVNP